MDLSSALDREVLRAPGQFGCTELPATGVRVRENRIMREHPEQQQGKGGRNVEITRTQRFSER
jgi:hypothetical protein